MTAPAIQVTITPAAATVAVRGVEHTEAVRNGDALGALLLARQAALLLTDDADDRWQVAVACAGEIRRMKGRA